MTKPEEKLEEFINLHADFYALENLIDTMGPEKALDALVDFAFTLDFDQEIPNG